MGTVDEREARDWRRQWMALMLSITFCGGVLFGLLMSVVDLPGVWFAPVLLVVSGGFFLFMSARR